MEIEVEGFEEDPEAKIHLDLFRGTPKSTNLDRKKKYHLDKKRPPKRCRPQQLLAQNVSTDDVENINGTN